MRGPGAVDRAEMPVNPQPEKIPGPMWDLIYAAETRLEYTSSLTTLLGVGSGAGAIVEEAAGEEKKDEDGANEEDPLVHKFSLPSPFKGLCESIKTN